MSMRPGGPGGECLLLKGPKDFLKGESQGHNSTFKGLKMTFRTKILRKKLYHVNQHQNTANFV